MATQPGPRIGIIVLVAFASALAGGMVARWLPDSAIASAPIVTAPLPALAAGTNSLSPLVERAAPAVVNIAVMQPSPAQQNPLLRDPFFRRQFGIPDAALEPTISAGSGVIVDRALGLVITNYHVIEKAQSIEVGLRDQRSFSAELVAAAPGSDIAILKITGRDLPALPFGNSDRLAVGDLVVAIGNPFGLGQTVTAGIVSATDRGLGPNSPRFIQTDAPINPGNSGGPLINARGEIVGINSAMISPNQGNVGIGFAIPANLVRDLLAEAKRRMGAS
jgi:S1-C subfamily serine protease